MKLKVYVLILLGFTLAMQASAQSVPYVSSFTINPTSIQNDYATTLSWQIAGGNGSNLYFSCPSGVSIKDENGSAVSCNTAVNTGSSASGSRGYTFINVSGVTANVPIRIVPRDENGAERTLGAASLGLTVSPATQPITDFSTSNINPKSGDTVKLSWSGAYASGVNLLLSCSENIIYSATDSAIIKCGSNAFSQDLAISGFLDVKITNTSTRDVPIHITVVPSEGGGLYDGTKSLSLDLTVAGFVLPPGPLLIKFSLSKPLVYSNEPFDISWETQNTKGANIQFQCDPSKYEVSTLVGTTTTRISCNAPAFSPALSKSGTTTVAILNREFLSPSADIDIILLLQQNDNTYITVDSKDLKARVLSVQAPSTVVATSSATSSQPQAQNPPTTTLSPNVKNIFVFSLQRGSRGSQVTELQKFLAKDKKMYPEGLVTGYFGLATESAVKRFQVKYSLAAQGNSGYGYVGPKTRSKLNSLIVP